MSTIYDLDLLFRSGPFRASRAVTTTGWFDDAGGEHMLKWGDREGAALHVLSIDFDYWYLGGAPSRLSHCGFCENYNHADLVRPPSLDVEEKLERGLMRGLMIDPRGVNYRMIFRRVAVGTPIHVSESHAAIVELLRELRKKNPEAYITVWNIDEHPDTIGGPTPFKCDCGNWVDFSGAKGYLDEYWWVTDRQHLLQLPRRPDLIFVCKSSPYLDVAGDRPLITFIRNLEKASEQEARVYGHASEPIRDALVQRRITP